jgi:hypoxanthine-guanine phosphoribosyltransferase
MSFQYSKNRHIVLKHSQIIKTIEQLAKEINHDYKDKQLTIVALLNSCLVFLVELLMRLEIDVEIMTTKVTTYTEHGEATKTGEHYVSPDFK